LRLEPLAMGNADVSGDVDQRV